MIQEDTIETVDWALIRFDSILDLTKVVALPLNHMLFMANRQ